MRHRRFLLFRRPAGPGPGAAGRPAPAGPPDRDWAPVIRAVWGRRAVPFLRYALCGAPEDFDRDRLAAFAAALPPGFSLSPILAGHYPLLTAQDWSRDPVRQFPGRSRLRPAWAGGHRSSGRGPRGRRLLLRRLGRRHRDPDRHPAGPAPPGAGPVLRRPADPDLPGPGLLPSWDAHDRRSAALAEKLGYRLDRPYPAYLLDQTGP